MRKHEVKTTGTDIPISRTPATASPVKVSPLSRMEREMLTTLNDMERWFEDALHRPFLGFHRLPLIGHLRERRAGDFIPSVDMFEEGNEVVVRAELAGIRREDIKVELAGTTLTLCGEKRGEEKVQRKDYYCVEQTYGSFSRSLELPEGVDLEQVKAVYKDGLLEIRIGRNAGSRKVVSVPIAE